MWDYINLAALLLSPVIAVVVTLGFQGRKEKRGRKERLFQTLMTYRMANPPPRELVQALNLIDVVFKENKEVRGLWKDYFAMLCRPPIEPEVEIRRATYLNLLSAMADDLGYSNLQQTDISRFYAPQFYEDEFAWGRQFRTELLRVLENTQHIVARPREVGDDTPASLPGPRKVS